MSNNYAVKRAPNLINIWFVWNNWESRNVCTVTSRKECRRLVVGLNEGWINPDEVEEAAKGNTAA
jgi:hypothetical protein